MKFSEREIQDYLWEKRYEWEDIVLEFPDIKLFDLSIKDSDVSPEKIIYNQVIKNLYKLYEKSSCANIFASEVPLMKNNNPMRVDMLSTFIDDTSIGIIELKKSKQTERQAFTELLAYSNYFTSLFPGSAKEDLFLILIAPMETKIVKEALMQYLLFDGRSIVAYTLDLSDENDIETLRLKPWVPNYEDISIYAQTSFSSKNLSVCKIVWEYSKDIWDPNPSENPEDYMIQNMDHVSSLAAQLMEKKGIHGFAYTSQVWSELAPVMPFTNSLVIVGMNPYAVASSNILWHEDFKGSTLPHPLEHLKKLEDVIPGLPNSREYDKDEDDRMYSLYATWDSNLYRIGKKVVDMATMLVDKKSPKNDHGFMSWYDYQRQFMEDITCHNFSIRPTGIFRDIYWDITKFDYDFSIKKGAENHPVLGDLYHQSIETLTSHKYFRIFLDRMFYSEANDSSI